MKHFKFIVFIFSLTIFTTPFVLTANDSNNEASQESPVENNIPDALTPADFGNIPDKENAPSEEELNEFLRKFLGTWIGYIHLSTMDGVNIRKFEVEQQYWWDEAKDSLEGLSVFEIDGEIQYAQSTHYIENHAIFTRVKEKDDYKTYKGRVKDNSIIWYPMDKRIALDHQLTESFVPTEQGMSIQKDGFERLRYKGIDTMLIVKGTLHAKPE